MINYVFENEKSSVKALKVIIGKRYQYIFDVLESTLGDFPHECATITCDVWIGKCSGCIHIDVRHVDKNVTSGTGSMVISNFVIGPRRYNKELCITHYTYSKLDRNKFDALVVYKDIEIPKKEKLTKVAYSYMQSF